MSYPINVDLIPNLPKQPYRNGIGNYEGICCHSTDDYNATAANEDSYFHNNWQNRSAFVHFIVGWDEIVQNADINYISWGCANGNVRYINIELCETADDALFQRSYDMYVWLIAKLLLDRKLGVTDGESLVSHDWVSKNLGGTNHTDPIEYLASHGVSWSQHVSNVQTEYNRQSNPVSPSPSQPMGVVTVICSALNLRAGSGTNFKVLRVLKNGERYLVWGEQNGFYNLGGGQWCSANPEYVKFTK